MNKNFLRVETFLYVCAIAFAIQQSAIAQITSPAEYSYLTAGTIQKIAWNVMGDSTGTVILQYTTDGGNSWNFIASSGINAGSYDWVIPDDVHSSYCMIRMQKYNGTDYATIASTGFFSISGADPNSDAYGVFDHREINLGKDTTSTARPPRIRPEPPR